MNDLSHMVHQTIARAKVYALSCDPNGDFSLPGPCNNTVTTGQRCHAARDFAEAYNMPAILGGYKLPEDVTGSILQDFALCAMVMNHLGVLSNLDYKNLLDRAWVCLVQDNPELKDLNAMIYGAEGRRFKSRYSAVYHGIMGVGDDYNVDDIRYFLSGPKPLYDFNTCAARVRIDQECGPMYWRPSAKTKQKIENILADRRKNTRQTAQKGPRS